MEASIKMQNKIVRTPIFTHSTLLFEFSVEEMSKSMTKILINIFYIICDVRVIRASVAQWYSSWLVCERSRVLD